MSEGRTKFGSEFWWSTGLNVLGIVLALGMFYAGINDKLKELLDRRPRVLNEHEAMTVIDLYLDAAQGELHTEIARFVRADLPQAIKNGNVDAAFNVVFAETDKTLTNLRARLSKITIAGGMSVQEFLDVVNPIEGPYIRLAKEQVHQSAIKEIGAGGINLTCERLSVIESSLVRFTVEAKAASRAVIVNELSNRYRTYRE